MSLKISKCMRSSACAAGRRCSPTVFAKSICDEFFYSAASGSAPFSHILLCSPTFRERKREREHNSVLPAIRSPPPPIVCASRFHFFSPPLSCYCVILNVTGWKFWMHSTMILDETEHTTPKTWLSTHQRMASKEKTGLIMRELIRVHSPLRFSCYRARPLHMNQAT